MKPILILLVLLILSVAGNWIQWRSAEVENRARFEENARAQQKAGEALVQIEQRDSAISTLRHERSADSVRYGLKNKADQRAINALKAKVKGPAVVQDTIIVFQDRLIASMDGQIDTLYLKDNVIIDSLSFSNSELKAMFVEEFKRNMKLEGRLKRERKKRWVIAPQAGIDFRGRPNVSLGIGYALFKF